MLLDLARMKIHPSDMVIRTERICVADPTRAASSSLASLALANRTDRNHLSATSADAPTPGGDLAYYYGRNGSVTGMNIGAAHEVIGSADLGVGSQALRAFEGISGGSASLS